MTLNVHVPRVRFLKENDAHLPPEERRVEIDPTPVIGHPILRPMVPGDDPVELKPATSHGYDPKLLPADLGSLNWSGVRARMLAQTGTVERTAAWSRWDRIRWGGNWLALGLVLGAITDCIIRWCLS
jgi:hypothetical protein